MADTATTRGKRKPLPSAESLKDVRAPAATPGINASPPSYAALATGGRALAGGLDELGRGFQAQAKAADEVDDYETKKKLIDFSLETEMALEEHKRTIAPGGEGFSDSWGKQYHDKAHAFFGKEGANIPERLRQKVDLALVQHNATLSERAQRYQLMERDKHTVEGLGQTLDGLKGFVEADPGRRDEKLNEGLGLIDLSPIPPADKYRVRRQFGKDLDKTAAIARLMKAETADDYKRLREDLGPDAPDRPERGGPIDARFEIKPLDRPAPSRGARAKPIEGIVIHHTAGSSLDGALSHGKLTGTGASYYVDRDGSVYQWAPEDQRMIHIQEPGAKVRNGALPNLGNDNTLGIEVVAKNDADVTPKQRAVLNGLLSQIATRNGIKPEYVIGHGEIQGGPGGNRQPDEGAAAARAWRELQAKGGAGAMVPTDAGEGEPAPEGTYSGPFSSLTLPERRALYNQAETKRKQAVAVLSKEISGWEKIAGDGYLLPPAMLDDLERRVTASGDPTVAAQFESTLGLAKLTADLNRRQPHELQAIVNGMRTKALAEGITPIAEKRIDHIEKVLGSMRQAINDDPLSWANRVGTVIDGSAVKLEPLNFADDATLSRRADQARAIGAYYHQEPKFFTKAERDALSDQIRVGGPMLINTLGKLYSSLGPDSMVLAVKEFAKDAPEAAGIGWLLARGGSAAAIKDASEGLALKRTQGFKPMAPNAHEARDAAIGEVGQAFKDFPQSETRAVALANTIYETRARREGLPATFDATRWRQAFKEALGEHDVGGTTFGGVVSQGWFGGHSIILPPTLNKGAWREAIDMLTTADLEAAGLGKAVGGDGKEVSMARVRSGTLVQTGDGRYAIATGDPSTPGQEKWIYRDKPGELLEIDFAKLTPILSRRRPDLFAGPGAYEAFSAGTGGFR